MKLGPVTLRRRLALAYGAALAVTLSVFSSGVYVLARHRLLGDIAERARHQADIAGQMLAEGVGQADEIEEHGLVENFVVVRGDASLFESPAWTQGGLPDLEHLPVALASGAWTAPDGEHFAIRGAEVGPEQPGLVVAVAESEEPARHGLAILAAVLLVGVPVTIGLSFLGASFFAGRLLVPVTRMSLAADRITADRLDERLPVQNPDDELGRLAVAFNRTLERLESSFDQLRRFTSDASHELRTPLTAMRTVGQLALRNGFSPEKDREAFVSILEEISRLAQLVDGLLLLTRDEKHVASELLEEVDAGKLVREVADLLRVLAEEREQRIEVRTDGAPCVRADRTSLRQAVANLLDNAIKYTPRGGEIRVSARRDGNGSAAIEVADNGPGIAMEHHERIFERFYRIEPDRSRGTGGAGLGLAIVRWAVGRNRGRIELESDRGRGSTFRIVLPLEPASRA